MERIIPDMREGWHTYLLRKGRPLRGWWGLYARLHALLPTLLRDRRRGDHPQAPGH